MQCFGLLENIKELDLSLAEDRRSSIAAAECVQKQYVIYHCSPPCKLCEEKITSAVFPLPGFKK